jgi:hypothetical protein
MARNKRRRRLALRAAAARSLRCAHRNASAAQHAARRRVWQRRHNGGSAGISEAMKVAMKWRNHSAPGARGGGSGASHGGIA